MRRVPLAGSYTTSSRGDPAALFRYLKEIEAANAERLVKLEPKPAIQSNRKVS